MKFSVNFQVSDGTERTAMSAIEHQRLRFQLKIALIDTDNALIIR